MNIKTKRTLLLWQVHHEKGSNLIKSRLQKYKNGQFLQKQKSTPNVDVCTLCSALIPRIKFLQWSWLTISFEGKWDKPLSFRNRISKLFNHYKCIIYCLVISLTVAVCLYNCPLFLSPALVQEFWSVEVSWRVDDQ